MSIGPRRRALTRTVTAVGLASAVCAVAPGGMAVASTSVGSGSCVQQVDVASGVTVATVTSGSTFCVVRFTATGANTWYVPTDVASFEYLLVAGGGGGGSASGGGGGGGGGAGGVLHDEICTDAATSFSLSVGAGGAGGVTDATPLAQPGLNGSDSTLGTFVAVGGGAGGARAGAGSSGGSGGGAGARPAVNSTLRPGGLGTDGQGNAGGDSFGQTSLAAGGGGYGGPGSASPNRLGGAGGAFGISGTTVTYAAGGLGGDNLSVDNGAAGADNSGDGGGGGNTNTSSGGSGGAGGSGIVVIRYAIDPSMQLPECQPPEEETTTTTEESTTTTGDPQVDPPQVLPATGGGRGVGNGAVLFLAAGLVAMVLSVRRTRRSS